MISANIIIIAASIIEYLAPFLSMNGPIAAPNLLVR